MLQKILTTGYANVDAQVFIKSDRTELIVPFAEKRASKDAVNNERGL